MHIAVGKGHRRIIDLLLVHGTNINAHNHNEATPFMIACLDEKIEIAGDLIDAGANVNFRGKVRSFYLARVLYLSLF